MIDYSFVVLANGLVRRPHPLLGLVLLVLLVAAAFFVAYQLLNRRLLVAGNGRAREILSERFAR